jgi:hypothetical protein
MPGPFGQQSVREAEEMWPDRECGSEAVVIEVNLPHSFSVPHRPAQLISH